MMSKKNGDKHEEKDLENGQKKKICTYLKQNQSLYGWNLPKAKHYIYYLNRS